jgi:hypothetical protein
MKPQSKQFNDKVITLTHDAVTNYIVINLIRSLSPNINSKILNEDRHSIGPCFEQLTESIRKVYRYVENTDCSDFTKKLFNKYAKEKISLTYLSCKSHEQKIMKNVVGTYKTLYCNICKIYDCKNHFLKDERWLDFDNTEGYKDYLYIIYFKKLIELSKSLILNRGQIFNSDNQISIFFLEMQNKEQILELKEIKSKIIPSKISIDEEPCSNMCFKNFLRESNDIIKEWNAARNISEESDEIYFMKLFQIHKFNPCIISQILKLKRKLFSPDDTDVSDCRVIYFKLLDIDLLSHLKQIKISTKNIKKTSKKTGNSNLIKNINKAKKESKKLH